jgi:co-chaperonin GroES (HSP10)
MKKEPVIGLYPLNDCVLVELKQSHKNFTTKEGKYDTRTEGIVVALPVPKKTYNITTMTTHPRGTVSGDFDWPKDLLGKRVHFEEFKEGARIKRNGNIYSFIKLEDIRGYENNEQTS